jgi:protein associated with RNAse G/E
MSQIAVVKQDFEGVEVIRYSGRVLRRGNEWVQLKAIFQLSSQRVGSIQLEAGDRFVELFHRSQWFNVHAVFAGTSDQLRGWYCNIAYPADITEEQVVYRDLALDLVVTPDQSATRLDIAEYQAMRIPVAVRRAADEAVAWLEGRAKRGQAPFRPEDPTAVVQEWD